MSYFDLKGDETRRAHRCFDCPHKTLTFKPAEQQARDRISYAPHVCHNATTTLCAGPAPGADLQQLTCNIDAEMEAQGA